MDSLNSGYKRRLCATWEGKALWDPWDLFERFTERARRVVVLAHEDARALKHSYIGTEHLLLGLLRQQEGLAARVLESLDITVERARAEVVRIVGSGEQEPEGQVPFTPGAKKVLELSLREAKSLGHSHIDTEHLLLGLLREDEGVAMRILLDFNVDPEEVRDEVIRMLPSDLGDRHRAQPSLESRPKLRQTIEPGWLDCLVLMLEQLAGEIHSELGRELDAGDLLLLLTTGPDTLPAQALQQLDVDLDELRGQIERLRRQAGTKHRQLADQIERTRLEKERAIQAQQFQTAAHLRDQERQLTAQQRAHTIVFPQALQAARRRLGLPTPPPPPAEAEPEEN